MSDPDLLLWPCDSRSLLVKINRTLLLHEVKHLLLLMKPWRLSITNHLEELNGSKIPGGVCLDRNVDNLFCVVLQKNESAEHHFT